MAKTGREAILDQMVADGMRTMFGNPGTVEQGFLDAMAKQPEMKYVLALQESIAVGMADGYARATHRPTLVQLHSGVGLGNGVGMMYQALRGHAPLVVIAGESGIRYDAMDAQMACDLVAIAKPVTKWSTRVVDPSSVLRVLRRAVKIAGTPPMGPVFVALPADVLDAPNTEEVFPTSLLSTRVAPEPAGVAHAAALLTGAKRPMVIMGDGVAFSDGQAELARIAETLGAEVWGSDCSEVNIADEHPCYKGQLGHMFGSHSSQITTQADAVLIVGTYVFPEVFPNLSNVFAPGAKVVHVDLNAYEIAKNFPVDLGIVADPKATMARVTDVLAQNMTTAQKEAARARVAQMAAAKEGARQEALAKDRAVRDEVPMHASRFMEELSTKLPADAILFDEGLTSSPEITRYLRPNRNGCFYQTRGGSLGTGFPGALGIKLAHPDRTVVGFSGDGGSMYTIQALWTAVRHDIGAKFVVCNNRSYMLLKLNIMQYWKEQGIAEHAFPAPFDLEKPELRFDLLAQSMGVPAVRVERPAEVGPAIQKMLATEGPFLVDLVITNHVPGSKLNCKCGQ